MNQKQRKKWFFKMKNKRNIIILFILSAFIATSFIGGFTSGSPDSTSQSMTGFVSPKTNSSLNLNDGQIAPFWSNVTIYENISEFGSGGYAKFANNGTYLFSLIVFPDYNEWISIEFEPSPDACMTNLNDGWSFYLPGSNQVQEIDVKFVGSVKPENDAQNDISIESIFTGGLVYIEVVRPFDTGDTAGYDIVLQNGSLNIIQFASENDHFSLHTNYYLLTTDYSIDSIDSIDNESTSPPIVIPVIPVGINLNQIKYTIIATVPIGLFIFIIFHAIRRVITKPIKHEYARIVGNSHTPPTFKKRWKDTFSKKSV